MTGGRGPAGASGVYGGVETGGTWTVCALGSGPEDLRDLHEFRTTTPAETIDRIARFFEEAPVKIEALGIGSFGPLELHHESPAYGSVLTTPKPGWSHAPLAAPLAQRLGVAVAIDLDVNAAGVAEQRWGAGRGLPSVAYVTVGTGIGAGVISGGRPLFGLGHPEVGHIRIPHDRERDPFDGACPLHGDCWEGLAAGPAIASRWGADPRELRDGHRAWELEADYLACGILAIALIGMPHRVIVGGGVAERPGLLERVRARLVELNGGYIESPAFGVEVDDYLVRPALGDRAGVLGALALASDAAARR